MSLIPLCFIEKSARNPVRALFCFCVVGFAANRYRLFLVA